MHKSGPKQSCFYRIWPNERLQCVVSLGLGRFDGALYNESNNSKNHQSGKNFNGTGEAKPLSLAQKFARIVDSATGKITKSCSDIAVILV